MKRFPIEVFLISCLVLSSCASIKGAWQNMTPAQKAKYAINGIYVVASEGIKNARLFMDNQEDLDAVQSKLNEVVTSVSSSVNIILAMIPPGMDGVSEFAQEKVDSLNTDVDALRTDFSVLEPLEEE